MDGKNSLLNDMLGRLKDQCNFDNGGSNGQRKVS